MISFDKAIMCYHTILSETKLTKVLTDNQIDRGQDFLSMLWYGVPHRIERIGIHIKSWFKPKKEDDSDDIPF